MKRKTIRNKLGIKAKLSRELPLNNEEQKKYIKTLHKKCWKLMSDKVRERDRYKCFTCGKVGEPKKMHAGHFMHSSQDFDERNIHCQCFTCNHMLSGNLAEYTIKMIELYGIDVVNELRGKKHLPHKYTIKELNEIFLWLQQTKLTST